MDNGALGTPGGRQTQVDQAQVYSRASRLKKYGSNSPYDHTACRMKTRVTDTIRSKNYVAHHVSRNDYYEKRKTIDGKWIGEACKDFGVEQGTIGRSED